MGGLAGTGVAGIIPARWGSSRLPGKPLALIGDEPMVVHVWRKAVASGVFDEVLVATDHPDIAGVVLEAGGRVAMTRDDHASGTDRCAEAAELLHNKEAAIINIQADEPFVDGGHLAALAEALRRDVSRQGGQNPPVATLCRAPRPGELDSPNRVVTLPQPGHKGLVLARKFTRDADLDPQARIHIGIYGFRPGILPELAQLQPSEGEVRERLEQLRWLENGYEIQLIEVEMHEEPPAVDTAEDLENARIWWKKSHGRRFSK